jgi:hypothetical protein
MGKIQNASSTSMRQLNVQVPPSVIVPVHSEHFFYIILL